MLWPSGSVPSECVGQPGLQRWKDRLQRQSGWIWADGCKERKVAAHAEQMSRESWIVKGNKLQKPKGMQLACHSHTSTVVHAYSTCWHRHTRLPEASFLGLSVKPYIHTADEEKEGEKERSRERLFSLTACRSKSMAKHTFSTPTARKIWRGRDKFLQI